MFISFEGLDFCGKSTQIKLLKDFLLDRNKKTIVIREPGGTPISEKIREILLDKKNMEMYFKTEMLLFASARAQLVADEIIPKLDSGYYVLSDRFHDSSIAYQGYGRGIDLDFLNNLQKYVIGEAVPDITFFLDIPIAEVKERMLKIHRGELDRMERMDIDFFTRVRKGYLELSEKYNRFRRLDGTQSIEFIQEQIRKLVVQSEKNIKL